MAGHLIFVYGSLKRGESNHREMAEQTFVGFARTVPGYRLFDLGEYPAMVAQPADQEGVQGEVWFVDDACLAHLDRFEGTPTYYRREPIKLLPPFADQAVETYVYAQSVLGHPELGSVWPVRK